MQATRFTDLDECLDKYTSWYTYNQDRVTSLDDCVSFLRKAINGRLYILHLMRDRIMALRNSYTNTTDLDRALDAFSQWYVSNHDTVVDVLPLLGFLKKATDDSLHLLHLMREQLNTFKAKYNDEQLIFLPTGYKV